MLGKYAPDFQIRHVCVLLHFHEKSSGQIEIDGKQYSISTQHPRQKTTSSSPADAPCHRPSKYF
ncbi:MAG: hypothetical protein MPL62_15040, partial [Alphaproteobacteria bacterium]|nr:hypothetical protein [Alphaproteobacteria bacterium]